MRIALKDLSGLPLEKEHIEIFASILISSLWIVFYFLLLKIEKTCFKQTGL
jgi:hypothetical protein